jgi:hypothetical protein
MVPTHDSDADEGARMTYPGGNRRIDRVLAEDYLQRISEVSLDELRSMRDEAEQEETDLSYVRRMLQGRMDILRAEVDRRAGGEGATSLIDLLPGILADDVVVSSPHGLGRHVTTEPSRADQHRRYVEALIADADLSNPLGHDDDSLARALAVFAREETVVSTQRKAVQQVMDACTAEMGRRYREGGAVVDDLLPNEVTESG